MKKKEQKQIIPKKVPRQIKDFVPAPMMKTLHQMDPFLPQLTSPRNIEYNESFIPSHILPEWTYQNNEGVNDEIFKEETEELFQDPEHQEINDNLPLYFIKLIENEIQWDRPTSYVLNNYIDKEIQQRYPKKNYSMMRDDIKANYVFKPKDVVNEQDEDEDGIENYIKSDTKTVKQTVYKDFDKYFEKEYDYRVVNCNSRLETDEEYVKRKQNDEKEKAATMRKTTKRGTRTKNANMQIKVDEADKIQVFFPQPSKLNLTYFRTSNSLHNSFYSWLTSVYQMILDQNINDSITHKNIIGNIFPQKDGAPIYNPKGKYIIKLYCMGKPRKVVIDDRIPCNKDHEYILPQCTYIEELWPALFTKALMKLEMYKTRHPAYYLKEEFMDPNLIYALTGLHTSIIDIEESMMSLLQNHFKYTLTQEDEDNIYFAFFKEKKTEYMEDKKAYEDIVNVFNKLKKKKTEKMVLSKFDLGIPNNYNQINKKIADVKSNGANPRKSFGNSGRIKKVTIRPSIDNTAVNNFVRTNAKFPTIVLKKSNIGVITVTNCFKKEELINNNKIISNFLYSVTDFFRNEDFNMKRLKYLDFSDLQKLLSEKKVQFKQLPLNEKKVYLLFRREMKKKQLEEKNRRILELTQSGVSYTLIKIIAQTLNIPSYDGFNDYTEEEIILAKKCIINHWDYLPVKYFESEFNEVKKIIMQQKIELEAEAEAAAPKEGKPNNFRKQESVNSSKAYISFLWSEECYLQLLGNDLEKYNTCFEPRKSVIPGAWITYKELTKTFDKLLIVHNTSKLFNHKVYSDNTWHYYKSDVFEPLEDYSSFIFTPEHEDNTDFYPILITYEPYTEYVNPKEKKSYVYPYITFDIIDLKDNSIIRQNVLLNKFYSVYTFNNMKGNGNYGLQIQGGVNPTGYILQIMSQAHTIANITTNEFLKKVYQYQSVSFKAEHPIIDPNTYWVFSRIHMTYNRDTDNELNDTSFKISLKYPIKYIKPFVSIHLQSSTSHKKKDIAYDEFVLLTAEEMKESYYIILSIKTEYRLKENTFEIEILYDSPNFHLEQIEHVEPYQIYDKYTVNKTKCLFSEYIYPSDKVSCSLEIKLKHLIIEEVQKTKTDKKTKDKDIINNSPFTFSEGKDIEKKTRLKLELYHLTKEPSSLDFIYDSLKYSYSNQGQLVYSCDFYNEIIITHLNLDGDFLPSIIEQNNKKKGSIAKKDLKEKEPLSSERQTFFPYLLICFFDENEVEEEILSNISGDIGWTIKVFSSDVIGFVKDNSKEDHENKLKDNWEEEENGRSLKASKSRQKYMILDKMKKGTEITKDEDDLIKEERERKQAATVDETQKEVRDAKGHILSTPNSKRSKTVLKDKKGRKKTVKGLAQPEIVQLPSYLTMKYILETPTPKLETSKSDYALKYLNYVYKDRTTIFSSRNKSSVMDNEYKEKMKQCVLTHFEESERTLRNHSIAQFFNSNPNPQESLRTITKSLSMIRLTKQIRHNKLFDGRNAIQQEYQAKYDIEKKIKDNLKDGITKAFDLNSFITLYREAIPLIGVDHYLINQLFIFISQKKEETIRNDMKKLSGKDQSQVVKLIEDINYNKWNISEEIMSKLRGLLKKEEKNNK